MARRPKRQVARNAAAKNSNRQPRPVSPAPRELHNLPTQLTSFIGREQEIAQIKRLLGNTRLLTLTGSGGSGKTRLALRVAADLLEQYHDGVRLVELGALADPALVPNSVAAALGIPERPNRPLTETLANYLRTKNMLLLLDNCEHLHAACQSLIDQLLRASATMWILATSRETLGVEGELTYRVPSLRLPDVGPVPPTAQLADYDAIRLFTARAALAQPGFALTERNARDIMQICRRLDGMPLAIEFAAALVMVLSVEQIAVRLDDRFRLLTAGTRKALPRQQTLRATLDWGYDLLSEAERALLRRLSVFAGGWTLEAAEAVCGADGIESSEILGLLSRLVEKSLVVAETLNGAGRYYLLETVRQYAQEKLVEGAAADELRRAHRDWYLAFAERAARELRGPREDVWLERLDKEHDNMRSALEWSKVEKEGAEAGLRLAGALHWFWWHRDHWNEGMRWTEDALARSSEGPPSALPRALAAAMHFAWGRGDYVLAAAFVEKGLPLCRELGDKESNGQFLLYLGNIASAQGDYERATALFDECLHVAQELGDGWLYGVTLGRLGRMARYQGDDERAAAFHAQGLVALRALGNKFATAYALNRCSRDVALAQRRYDEAVPLFKESLLLSREARSRWRSEECLEGLAQVASARGQYEHAARLFGAAEAQREIVGQRYEPADQASHEQWVAPARAALGDTTFSAAWADGRVMTLEQAVEYALAWVEPDEPAKPRQPGRAPKGDPLTAREREIAALVARGQTNREIATTLVISERTADAHVQNILNKLGFSSRAQIAAWAAERGLRVDPGTEASDSQVAHRPLPTSRDT
jgi:predicted ATPase/DNA-binding CsgD family transcriptional regulator